MAIFGIYVRFWGTTQRTHKFLWPSPTTPVSLCWRVAPFKRCGTSSVLDENNGATFLVAAEKSCVHDQTKLRETSHHCYNKKCWKDVCMCNYSIICIIYIAYILCMLLLHCFMHTTVCLCAQYMFKADDNNLTGQNLDGTVVRWFLRKIDLFFFEIWGLATYDWIT